MRRRERGAKNRKGRSRKETRELKFEQPHSVKITAIAGVTRSQIGAVTWSMTRKI